MTRTARRLIAALNLRVGGRRTRERSATCPRRFLLEALESRRLPSLITVYDSAGDDDAGTLAWAIAQSNENPSPSIAQPNIIVFTQAMDIELTQPLPPITAPVIIDGYSAGGTVNDSQNSDDATISVQVDGSQINSSLYPGAEGFTIEAYNCTIDGLSITGFAGSGIDIEPPSGSPPTSGAIGATIWGNWIGVAPDGSADGDMGAGVIVADANNVIGGTLPGGRNLIENSGDAGVVLCGTVATGNLVEGDFITNNDGDGVLALSANNVIGQPIGTLTAGAGDVISGNLLNGVCVRGPSAQGNIIANDEIGTTAAGDGEEPNGGDGVLIEDSPGNVVGGTTSNALNVIAANLGEGVMIENDQGNPLPSVPAPVGTILQDDGISIDDPAADATGNIVEGDHIGYNLNSSDELILMPNEDGVFLAASGNTIGGATSTAQNIIIANNRDGVVISNSQLDPSNNPGASFLNAAAPGSPGPAYDVIEGNFIGTQGGGDDYGNTLDGVFLYETAGDTIGGLASGAGNVISGNDYGIVLDAPLGATDPGGGDVIEGNDIGTTSAGTAPLPNAADGIEIDGVPNNTIGGTIASAANIISGNVLGIALLDPGTTGNVVWGNFIGTDATGQNPVRNAGDGIFLSMCANNTIGGLASGEGNTIAFNTENGVELGAGTVLDPTEDDAILTNAIYSNGASGIVLDGLANDDIAAPGISAALPDNVLNITEINGTLTGAANSIYLVQFFSTPAGVPESAVEGETWIGSATVKTDANGEAIGATEGDFSVDVNTLVTPGSWITATATLQEVNGSTGVTINTTSELSTPPVEAINPFLVTSTADPAAAPVPGTLRYAINFSNEYPSPDVGSPNTIAFDIPGVGLQTLRLEQTLTITSPIVIDGYSQPGSVENNSSQYPAPDTDDDQETDIAVIEVQIDGSLIQGASAIGLDVQAPDCTIDGLSLTGFSGAAIFLEPVASTVTGAVGENSVWGNFIGVSQFNSQSTVTVLAADNSDRNGVGILVDSPNNVIGGTATIDRNVIQANAGDGVILFGSEGTGNTIASNFILDNGGDGVLVLSASNHIGEASGEGLAGAGNLISGNQENGVHILGPSARGNTIANDEIGTQVGIAGQYVPRLGTAPRPNSLSGVLIEDAPANTVGGLVSDSGNVIAGNTLDGITIENFNNGVIPTIIGPQPPFTSLDGATHNVIEGNLIGFNDRNDLVESIGNQEDGVNISSSGNTVGGAQSAAQNVIVNNGRNGITIAGVPLDAQDDPISGGEIPNAQAVANLVANNFVGTVAGDDQYGNSYDGILIDQAGDNTIGGSVSGTSNVVSNNNVGIAIVGGLSLANLVEGDLIGTTSDGSGTLGNATDGVAIIDAAANTIGGTLSAAADVIAGNENGVHISGTGALENLVEGDFIGTNASGSSQIGNSGAGVLLDGGASNNTIGGTVTGATCTIADNGGIGVDVFQGDGDSILSNSMSANASGGIVLNGSSNDDQAAPIIETVTPLPSSTVLSATLASTPDTIFLVQVFASTTADGSGSFEGAELVGSTTVTTDSGGQADFGLTLTGNIPEGTAITATATSLSSGDTSAFSTGVLNAPSIAFSATAFDVSEPSSQAVITVIRDTGVGSSSVVYSASAGTAVAGVDFTPVTAALTFAAGQTVATFDVSILDTQGRDGQFTVELALSDPSGAGLGTPATAILTITSSPGTLQFSSTSAIVPETAGNTTITVDRTGGASGTVSVNYATTAIDAVAGEDYVPVSGTLTFGPGVTQQSFALPILGNSANPDDATIALTLTSPTGGAVLGAPTTETVTIDKPLIVTNDSLVIGAGGITAVVLTFNKPLDAASAVNLANYGFFAQEANSVGIFAGGGSDLSLASASYDSLSQSVTLDAASPLPMNRVYRITVDGNASMVLDNGLTDVYGGLLEGSSGVPGSPYLITFGAGTHVTYTDDTGAVVTLQLRKGGVVSLFQSPSGSVQELGLIGAIPGRSKLTITEKRVHGRAGRTALPPISGAGGVRILYRGQKTARSDASVDVRADRAFARRPWHR